MNVQKTPLVLSLQQHAKAKAQDAIELLGKALPCSVTAVNGAIITVKFEIQTPLFTLPPVDCPLFGPEYIRYPIQVGDKGVVFPADTYLGGMSGLGGGTADMSQRANLSTLVFFPIGNKNWTTFDPQFLVLYGKGGGVIIQDSEDGNCIFTLTSSGITITVGGKTWHWNADGLAVDGWIHSTQDIIASTAGNNISVTSHLHSQGPDSHGDAEENTFSPVPGT